MSTSASTGCTSRRTSWCSYPHVINDQRNLGQDYLEQYHSSPTSYIGSREMGFAPRRNVAGLLLFKMRMVDRDLSRAAREA